MMSKSFSSFLDQQNKDRLKSPGKSGSSSPDYVLEFEPEEIDYTDGDDDNPIDVDDVLDDVLGDYYDDEENLVEEFTDQAFEDKLQGSFEKLVVAEPSSSSDEEDVYHDSNAAETSTSIDGSSSRRRNELRNAATSASKHVSTDSHSRTDTSERRKGNRGNEEGNQSKIGCDAPAVAAQGPATSPGRRRTPSETADTSSAPKPEAIPFDQRSPSVGRRRYSMKQRLPTLDETSDRVVEDPPMPLKSRSASVGDVLKLDGGRGWNSAQNSTWLDNAIKSLSSPVPPSKHGSASKTKKPSRLQKVKELQATASDLAQRGDEEAALRTYRRALHVAGTEMSKINAQIKKSKQGMSKSRYSPNSGSPLPIAAVQSIQKRIQEDLLAMSDRIGKIRIVMTILYERMGEYDKAMDCCKEAVEVYKHQQLLNADPDSISGDQFEEDGNSNNNSAIPVRKGTKERLRDTKKMMHRLQLGQTCYNERNQVVDEMTQLRREISRIAINSPNGPARRDGLLNRLYGIAFKQLNNETNALGKSHPQIADALQLMATLSQELGNNDDTAQYLLNAFKVLRANLGMRHPKTAQMCLKLARLHRTLYDSNNARLTGNTNHEDFALEYFLKACDILRESRLRPTLLGSTLNDAAIIYMKRHDFARAIDLLKEALTRYEENTESITTSVAADLMSAGNSSSSSLNNSCSDLSSKWCGTPADGISGEEATSSSSSLSGSGDSNHSSGANGNHQHGNLSIEALQVWRNLGESYYQVQECDKAKDAFANALEIQRSIRTIHDAVSELDLGIVGVEEGMLKLVDDASIIDTLSRFGKACAASGRHHDALVAYKESLELMNRIAVDEELYKDLTNHQVLIRRQLLSKTLYCIGSACSEVNEYNDAIKYYSEAIQHSRLCASSSVDAVSRVQEAAHCALCFAGIADVNMKQEKYTEALKIYNDTLKYCEMKGLESDHSVVETLLKKKKETEHEITELPRSNAQVAQLEARALEEMNSGRLDDSILTLTEAMGILRSSFAQAKLAGFDSSEHLCAIARMLQTLASVFLEKGEEENAERVFQDAIRLFRQSGAQESLSV